MPARPKGRVFLFALSVLLAGCAIGPDLPPLTCPGLGGPRWVELSTAHLELRTDIAPADARALAPELERDYQLIAKLMAAEVPGVAPPEDRVEVVLFRDDADLKALHPSADGFFHVDEQAWNPEPAVLLEVARGDRLGRLFRHEITHRFVAHYLPTAPAWLNEGLAQLFSTAVVERDHIVVGRYSQELHYYGYQPNVREVFAADELTFAREGSYYTEAWALVHLLQSEREGFRPRFSAYLKRLAGGLRADLAWQATFPSVDLDELENVLNLYHAKLRYDTRTVAAGPSAPPPSASERAMSDGEVHLLWVELRPWTRSNGPALAHDLEEATRESQPRDFLYWKAGVWVVFGRRREALAWLTSALAQDPDDRRLLRAAISLDPQVALGQRLEKVARSGREWLEAAIALSYESSVQAIEDLKRAVKADPGCAYCWATLGVFERDSKALGDAIVAMQRASWLAPASGHYLEALHEWIESARAAGLQPPAAPIGIFAPPLFTPPEGVQLAGRVVDDATGAPLARVWVHANAGDGRFALARTDEHGQVRLGVRPGVVQLTLLPDAPLLADRRWVHVQPRTTPLDLGDLKLVRGRFPDPVTGYDGIGPVSRDGRAYVKAVGPESPAARAGVRPGERLLRINGHDVHDLGPNAIDLLLAGPPGTPIAIELAPESGGPSRVVRFALAPVGRAHSFTPAFDQ